VTGMVVTLGIISSKILPNSSPPMGESNHCPDDLLIIRPSRPDDMSLFYSARVREVKYVY
jgi:hypothetical protein